MDDKNIQKLTKKQFQEKIKKLEKELEEKKNLAEKNLNQLKYLQADFDNYRKKFEKEKDNIIKTANESLIKELLVVIDDFERALQSIKDKENKKGLTMIYKNLFKILEYHGLKKIEALYKKFDPYYHEAILKEKSDKSDGCVLEEIQRGYLLHSGILRHSKVKIADNKSKIEGDKKND